MLLKTTFKFIIFRRVSRLEDLPEESSETEESTTLLTPKRSSSRNTNKTLNYSSTKRTSSKTSKH